MVSPFITREGVRRVDTCCTGNCNQGRTCGSRQACELPLDDFDPSKPNVLATLARYGIAALLLVGVCAAPLFFR